MSHYNSAQNPTEVNLDAATLASPSGEDHTVPLQYSHLIPEYANLHTSRLRQRKIIQDKDKRKKSITKVSGLIEFFESVAMSTTKSILTDISIFSQNAPTRRERKFLSRKCTQLHQPPGIQNRVRK